VSRRAVRFGPWLLALAVAVFVWAARGVSPSAPSWSGEGTAQERAALSATPSPDPEGAACALLYALSEQAARLTGALAPVEAVERRERAREAAAQVRALAAQAADITCGEELAEVLTDLAEALEGYAEGRPAALAGVRNASARNGQLREQLESCSGGER